MIEKNFDIPFIADLALREKQIQQNYRPIIAVHKWFARRPGTLFRGLLLSEFSGLPLREAFYRANDLKDLRVADPFMGGGTPLLEANRVGCEVIGFDINPMSYWIVKQEIEHLDLEAYDVAVESLGRRLEKEIGHLYQTECVLCGKNAPVKYFLWVKVTSCSNCRKDIDLFPATCWPPIRRHPKNVFVCSACGQLDGDRRPEKSGQLPALRRRAVGEWSGRSKPLPLSPLPNRQFLPEQQSRTATSPAFRHRISLPVLQKRPCGAVLQDPRRSRSETGGRSRGAMGRDAHSRFVPDDEIPSGDETNRLHRWGYRFYREMFNARQLLGLELSARIISKTSDERVRNALATNLSDLLRYQNMLCRYDTMALKSLDIFSVHGFPVGLIQCESNFLGIRDPNKNMCVGSGGWANIIDKFRKAKAYCDAPFEIRHHGFRKEIVPIKGEWIGDHPNGGQNRGVERWTSNAGMRLKRSCRRPPWTRYSPIRRISAMCNMRN